MKWNLRGMKQINPYYFNTFFNAGFFVSTILFLNHPTISQGGIYCILYIFGSIICSAFLLSLDETYLSFKTHPTNESPSEMFPLIIIIIPFYFFLQIIICKHSFINKNF
jgi:uncharacterized membrane protein YfcA